MNPQAAKHEEAIFRTILILGMIFFAAIMRIVSHPWNLAPVGAMVLFSGAVIRNRVMAFVLPLLAMLTGDFFIGFHKLMPVVYVSFVISTAIGLWLRERRSVGRLGGAVLVGAIQFFLVTNFGVWAFLNSYPKTLAGLMACYAAGVPFFWNTLAGDVCYSALLFGALFLAERTFPALKPNVSAVS
ncbi:MAG TPA: DUF6580 family putative transport protein [Candidatus Acidoferrum sp.]|jgi:hypothetical protein|nr:DUF6580 family putative transport protein [Candidatus Acidoferrum sp.]